MLLIWKHVYKTLCQETPDIELDIIESTLDKYQDKLLIALLAYKPYTKESFETWCQNVSLDSMKTDAIRSFINKLSLELDLDVNICWIVLSHFIENDYYGKVVELKSIFDINSVALIKEIWTFYTSERMFLLKILRHIFTKAQDENHILYNQFNNFIKSLNLDQFWCNIREIFDYLFMELHNKKYSINVPRYIDVERWAKRNFKEQVEIVLLMIDVLNFYELKPEEFEATLHRFCYHNFGRTPLCSPATFDATNMQNTMQEMQEADIGCILAMANQILEKPHIFNNISKQLEECLIHNCRHVDYRTTFTIWIIIKIHFDQNQEYFTEKINFIMEQDQPNVFNFLYQVMSSYVFSSGSLARLIHYAMYKIFLILNNYVATESKIILFEQEKFPYIIAALIKYGFLKLEETYIDDYISLALKMFPYKMEPLVSIFKEILKLQNDFTKIQELLNNMTTYLDNALWLRQIYPPKEEYETEQDIEIFDSFVINKGSKMELFTINSYEVTLYYTKFTFYGIMDKFINGLLKKAREGTGFLDETLASYITQGFVMIIEIINNYEGCIKDDKDLINCVSRLDCIPQYFAKGPLYNKDLILTYFRVKIALIKSNQFELNDVVPTNVQKILLPQINVEKYSSNEVHSYEICSESILQNILKEEEDGTDHRMLMQYLQLLIFAFKNNKYLNEVQKPGLVYLTFNVFPHYASWRYTEISQSNKIIGTYYKMLASVIAKNRNSEMFHKYIDLFINKEWAITVFTNYFSYNKYYLNDIMNDDVNWGENGRAAFNISVFKLQVTLLILFTKSRLELDKNRKYVFDRLVHDFCKSITGLMVTHYDTSLCELCFKLLQVLAQNTNTPLMSLIGLDYDHTQKVFLEPLRNPMESYKIKTQILELISVCVLHQHGFTVALFDFKLASKKSFNPFGHKLQVEDSMTKFIKEFVIYLKVSHNLMENSQKMLKIICNLWAARKEKLLHDLMKLNIFWSGLFSPLFNDFNLPAIVYYYIFRLINFQLCSSVEDYPHFQTELKKFIDNRTQLTKFFQYMMTLYCDMENNQEDAHYIKGLVKYWTLFLIYTEKHFENFYSDDSLKFFIINSSLTAINLFFDIKLPQWIYLLYAGMRNWKDYKYAGNEKYFAQKLKTSLDFINKFYQRFSYRLRSTIISIYHTIIISLKSYYEDHLSDLLELLKTFGLIIDHEYKEFEQIDWQLIEDNPDSNCQKILPWLLIVNTVNELFEMKCINELSIWFKYDSYILRLFNTLPSLIGCKKTLKYAKLVIYSATLYFKTSMISDLYLARIIGLYDSIEPQLRGIIENLQEKNEPKDLKDLFKILSVLMRFNQTIFNKFKHSVAKNMICFSFVFDFMVIYIISLPEYTIDENALDLLILTICLIHDVLLHANKEFANFKTINTRTLNGIRAVINFCITAILRSENLVLYQLDQLGCVVKTKMPPNSLPIIINKLITVVNMCCSCLYKINTDYVSLLPKIPHDIFEILIHPDFGELNFDVIWLEKLTYNRLLCLSRFLSNTLTQLQHQSDTQPNKDMNTMVARYSGYTGRCSLDESTQNDFLQYGLRNYSALSHETISKLDMRTVKNCLEMLFVFISTQIYLLNDVYKQQPPVGFRENVLPKMKFLYDFGKKCAIEYMSQQTNDQISSRNDIFFDFLVYLKRNVECEKLTDEYFHTVLLQWFKHYCRVGEIKKN